MLSATLGACESAAPKGAPTPRPHAVFISGLPGSGKSSLSAHALSVLEADGATPPAASFASLDADSLRSFHAQFQHDFLAAGSCQYEELIPWFLEGSGFEESVFRAPSGLAQSVLDARHSFVQPAVFDSAAYLDWIDHVSCVHGYIPHFVFVHAPLETAIVRATARAATTGRFCSPTFVSTRHAGLVAHTRGAWGRCLAAGGSVTCFDNSGNDLVKGLTPHIALMYGLESELVLTPGAVSSLAARIMDELFPPHSLSGLRVALAGGAFSKLLLPDDGRSAFASHFRDIDV